MTEREELVSDIGYIARGCVFVVFNINLGTLNILPDWFGYMMILSVLPGLSEHEPSIKHLRTPCIFLIAWEILQWGTTLFGIIEFNLYALEVLVTVMSLYFHFQLFTNIANIAGKYGCPEKDRILKLRTVRTLTHTVFSLPLPWMEHTSASIIILLISIVVGIWICITMFSLRDSLKMPEDLSQQLLTPEERKSLNFHKKVWDSDIDPRN